LTTGGARLVIDSRMNRNYDGCMVTLTTDGPSLVIMNSRMNRNYDGCTGEYSLSKNLLMEKESKL